LAWLWLGLAWRLLPEPIGRLLTAMGSPPQEPVAAALRLRDYVPNPGLLSKWHIATGLLTLWACLS